MDRGDHRCGIVDDGVEHLLERGTERVGAAAAAVGEAGAEIGAGAERGAGAGDDDGEQVTMLVERGAQLIAVVGVERVAPFGAIDRGHADAAVEASNRITTRR